MGRGGLRRGREQQKPVFLSIGYSACHWCHVMAHESFENAAVAELLNEQFVRIKVDREERPDVDQVYMEAVQMMTGRGGWPLSVFLTPAVEPFFGGTYWPLPGREGLAGFDARAPRRGRCLAKRRGEVFGAGPTTHQLSGERRRSATARPAEARRRAGPAHRGGRSGPRPGLRPAHGGFGPAPKFPRATAAAVVATLSTQPGRDDLLHMVTLTLDHMAAGGIYDHLGGGFHRYSVDDRWLVPHFEKMLYDNALLAGLLSGSLAVDRPAITPACCARHWTTCSAT